MQSLKNRMSVLTLATCFLLLTPSLFAQKSTNEALIKAYVEAWNAHSVDDLDALLAADFTRSGPKSAPQTAATSLANMKEVMSSTFKQNPDAKVTVHEALYGDDHATLRWTFATRGTKTDGITLFKFKDGKIASAYVTWDTMGQMQQLGFTVTPPAEDSK